MHHQTCLRGNVHDFDRRPVEFSGAAVLCRDPARAAVAPRLAAGFEPPTSRKGAPCRESSALWFC